MSSITQQAAEKGGGMTEQDFGLGMEACVVECGASVKSTPLRSGFCRRGGTTTASPRGWRNWNYAPVNAWSLSSCGESSNNFPNSSLTRQRQGRN